MELGFSKKEYFELSDMLYNLVGYDISQLVGYDTTRGGGLAMIEKSTTSTSTSGNNIYNKFNGAHKNKNNNTHKNKKEQPINQKVEQPKKPIVISGYKSVYVYKPKGIYVLDFGDGSNSDDYKELVTKAEDFFGFKEVHTKHYNGYLCGDGFVYRQSKNDKRIIVKCDPETDEELEVFLDGRSMGGVYAVSVRGCTDGEYLKIGIQPYYHPPTYYYYDIYTKGQTAIPTIVLPRCICYHDGAPITSTLSNNEFSLVYVSAMSWDGRPLSEEWYDIPLPDGDIFCRIFTYYDPHSIDGEGCYTVSGASFSKLDNNTYIITSLYGTYKFNVDTRRLEQIYFDDSNPVLNTTKVDKYLYFTKRNVLYRFNTEENFVDKSINLPIDPVMDIVGECGFLPYNLNLAPTKDFVLVKVSESNGYNRCGGGTPINQQIHFDTFYFLVNLKEEKVSIFPFPNENEFVGVIKDDNIVVFKRKYTEETDEDSIPVTIFTLYDLTTDLVVELAPIYYCDITGSDDNAIYLQGSLTHNQDDIRGYKITKVKIEKEFTLCPIKIKNYVCHIYNENKYHIIKFSNGKTVIVPPKDTPAEPIELKIKVGNEVGVENEVGTAPLKISISDESKYKFSKFFIDFGDGSSTITNKIEDVLHTYFSVGHYNLVVYGYLSGTIYTYTTTIFVNNKLEPPVSKFSVSKQSEYVGRNIEFENLSTGGFDSLLWDFGDGSTSTSLNPVHTYTSSGLYTVTLYIYSDNQVASKFSQTIQIKDLKKLIINPTNFRLKIGSTAGFNGKFSIPSFKLTTGLCGNSHIYKKNDSSLPTITLGKYPSFIFKGKEIDFYADATDNPFYIKWDIDNHILYGNHIKYTFNTQGTFNITVSAENAAGVSSINFSVVVFSKIVEAGVFKYYYTLYTDINKVFIYNAFNNEFYRSIGGLGSTIGKFNKPTSLTVINPM